MAVHSPPKYLYSLFRPWDKEAFTFIKQVAKTKNYPKILGTREDKNRFLVALIRTQKAQHGWRAILKDTLSQVKNTGVIDTRSLNKKYPPKTISKDVPAWVSYKEDEIVSDFVDELGTKRINFVGSDRKISEFTMRFILGQLCYGWRRTIMMIWEMLGDGNKLDVKSLNKEMRHFDYLGFFE